MTAKIPVPPKEELEYWFHEENLSNREVADLYGCSINPIKAWKRKYGLVNDVGAKRNGIPRKLQSFPLPSDMSWAIGFLAADGNLVLDGNGSYTLRANVRDRDKEVLHYLKEMFGGGEVIGPYKNAYGNDMYSWGAGVNRSLSILGQLSIVPKKSRILELPDTNLISLPHYLRGLFDGDGCWHKKKKKQYYKDRVYRSNYLHFSYTTVSKKMAEQLLKVTNGITGSRANLIVKENYSGAPFETDSVSYGITYDSRNARKLAEYVYGDNPYPRLGRKHEIVQEFI